MTTVAWRRRPVRRRIALALTAGPFVRIPGWTALLLGLLAMVTSAAAASALVVERARMRPAAAGGTTAAYLRLRNPGSRPVSIVEVSSPVATAVEIHRTRHQGDVMRMEMLRELTVPAGGAVTLAPQGLHLMVIGVKKPLAAGERVLLRFVLADGRHIEASAIVGEEGVR